MKRVRQQHYNQLIAVNLIDWIKGLENNPPPISGFKRSRLEYLIHLIISHKQKKHKGSWSVLNMGYMTNIVPQANRYLTFLRDSGVIEWMNYSADRFSRKYRLVHQGKTEFRTITDQQLIRRIEANRKALSVRNSKKYPHLNRWIYKVEIDWDSALQTIEQIYKDNSKKNDGWRTYALAAIDRIRIGELYISVNKTNNRLDSNFTNLPKELVQHLVIGGKHLYELDISNSQPFFSACLFQPTQEIEKIMVDYLGKSHIMLIKSLELSDKEDVKRYCSLVGTGKFYEYMAKRFKEEGIEFTNRADVKKEIFIVFFGKSTTEKYNKAVKLFKKEFPTVYRLFRSIKKQNNNRLAILLQRIESYVMLERVAERISKEFPDIPFLTKHDSIMPVKLYAVANGEIEKVRAIMVDTIKEVIGIIPPGKMKRYV